MGKTNFYPTKELFWIIVGELSCIRPHCKIQTGQGTNQNAPFHRGSVWTRIGKSKSFQFVLANRRVVRTLASTAKSVWWAFATTILLCSVWEGRAINDQFPYKVCSVKLTVNVATMTVHDNDNAPKEPGPRNSKKAVSTTQEQRKSFFILISFVFQETESDAKLLLFS